MQCLHLGSGRKRIPGYLNVDANQTEEPDILAPIDDLQGIETDSIDAIYACHVLEHARRENIGAVLGEWHRVLKPGGELRVAVPDFEAMVLLYVDQGVHLERLWGLFYGGGKTVWDRHQVLFDYETLCTYLQRAGFHSLRKYDAGGWLDGFLDKGDYIDFSTAIINDQLISLNVLAVAK